MALFFVTLILKEPSIKSVWRVIAEASGARSRTIDSNWLRCIFMFWWYSTGFVDFSLGDWTCQAVASQRCNEQEGILTLLFKTPHHGTCTVPPLGCTALYHFFFSAPCLQGVCIALYHPFALCHLFLILTASAAPGRGRSRLETSTSCLIDTYIGSAKGASISNIYIFQRPSPLRLLVHSWLVMLMAFLKEIFGHV